MIKNNDFSNVIEGIFEIYNLDGLNISYKKERVHDTFHYYLTHPEDNKKLKIFSFKKDLFEIIIYYRYITYKVFRYGMENCYSYVKNNSLNSFIFKVKEDSIYNILSNFQEYINTVIEEFYNSRNGIFI